MTRFLVYRLNYKYRLQDKSFKVTFFIFVPFSRKNVFTKEDSQSSFLTRSGLSLIQGTRKINYKLIKNVFTASTNVERVPIPNIKPFIKSQDSKVETVLPVVTLRFVETNYERMFFS